MVASDRSDQTQAISQSNSVTRCNHKDLETFLLTDNEAMMPQESDLERWPETDNLTLRLGQDRVNQETQNCRQPFSTNNMNQSTQYDTSRTIPSAEISTDSTETALGYFMASNGMIDDTHTHSKNSQESRSTSIEDRTKSESSNDSSCDRYDVEEHSSFYNKLNLHSSVCESEEKTRKLTDDIEDVYQPKSSRCVIM